MLKKVQRPLLNFKESKDKAKDRRKSSSNDQNQEDIYLSDDAVDNDILVIRLVVMIMMT